MSFEIEVDQYEEAGGRLVAEFGVQLQELFMHRKEHDEVTQQVIAERLNVDRSRINRCLSGFSNLTMSTLGELVHAMDGVVVHHVIPKEQLSQWRIVRVSPSVAQSRTIMGFFGDRPHIHNIAVPTNDSDTVNFDTSETTSITTQVKRNLKWAAK